MNVSGPPSPIPPEQARHKAIWTAWPWMEGEWGAALAEARVEIAAMVRALHAGGQGEPVRLLARAGEPLASARAALADVADIIPARYGDIWLRDTGPVFTRAREALAFGFNGWGGKYVLEGDETVADFVAHEARAPLVRHDFVLEGGAVEFDGAGSVLTTRQCVLNRNRNPGWDERDAEAALREAFGVEKVLWLDEGLANDHTDGHIDNLARFAAPGLVLCQAPSGSDDPNAGVLDAIARALEAMTDAGGRRLDVVRIPSPGLVASADGAAMAASHMNYVIGNEVVLVPTYNARGEDAVRDLARTFTDRRVIGLPARAILVGGGSFHCITREEPA